MKSSIDTSFMENDAWVRALVESAVDAIVTIDEFGSIQYSNPATDKLFGYSPEELKGKNVKVLMPTPYHEEHDGYIENYRNTHMKKIIGIGREVRGRRKDGSTFPLYLAVSEVNLDEHRMFTGILRDISREKQSLEEQERLLGELKERNKKITCLYSVGEVLRASDSEERLFHRVVQLIRPACNRPELSRARIFFDEQCYSEAEFEATEWTVSTAIVVGGRRRGYIEVHYSEQWYLPGAERLVEEDRNLIEAIARTLGDTIERRDAEAQVIQASKLASIGELAAGVGHEINNPVNGIMNCADILIKQTEEGSKERKFAELIRAESDRIATIVQNLLTFSRQEREQHSLARFCDIINAVLTLSEKKIKKSNIQLVVDVPENLPKFKCRSEQIQQVVMNLLINSIHALDDKEEGEKVLQVVANEYMNKGEPYIRLKVEDNGVGIAQSHIDRLFDPFFTTKGRDKGTGLGLSVSDGIIKNHGGTIRVESEKGAYTRFYVELPLDNAWVLDHETKHTGE